MNFQIQGCVKSDLTLDDTNDIELLRKSSAAAAGRPLEDCAVSGAMKKGLHALKGGDGR
jgi:hypothetical protein